uniref:Uncharacterized protein n=1 Tax=Clastoptera arizonana TaxID=38151 RepID=A0A1B6DZ75_9HEMI
MMIANVAFISIFFMTISGKQERIDKLMYYIKVAIVDVYGLAKDVLRHFVNYPEAFTCPLFKKQKDEVFAERLHLDLMLTDLTRKKCNTSDRRFKVLVDTRDALLQLENIINDTVQERVAKARYLIEKVEIARATFNYSPNIYKEPRNLTRLYEFEK